MGIIFLDTTISCSLSKRLSGSGTIPTFGSIVQNGKFSAGIADLVKALNKVDLPTLGRPIIPHLNPIILL